MAATSGDKRGHDESTSNHRALEGIMSEANATGPVLWNIDTRGVGDVVVAADNAMFSIPEARWGLTAAIIIPQLVDAMGVRQVRRYALTGERFGAEEGRRIGLVHEVVALAELAAAGGRMIDRLLENG